MTKTTLQCHAFQILTLQTSVQQAYVWGPSYFMAEVFG